MINLNELSKMLKKKRIESGLSQEEFAKTLGFTASYISRLENGKVSPTFKSLEKISEHIGIKANLFFG
ncbi:helix-turn-helix domain-containing protein [Bacillus pumilus]|jgi:transcriptional regulator with XRE-family HTH domain|uniref:helix-turn-helix domain-containing protein n=1 Tax=Bacillus pumilus TaxID=1408 RepID=UPI0008201D2E|nr:helix-turn-helix transcriptional regulator [Bacillus pumilus]AOC55408.1 XRE family transcriptional regulator [Bacillus pumilus]MBR0587103.1 helix-turn-helix transcriptional regulator [Bacillus pumilus DW2J2]MBR0618511.1 helix-turn-helix transcriptional regulator [Bacillus pumilus]MBR0624848.1 helix-turn-helix transcriptional regulator [Bacillus pumilus]MCY7724737.1 helix-turn-helix transcriptional regulator [Bacillus pumilus]